MDIKGLDYNTQREKLIMPEYGREIQKMVEYACELPTKEERLQCARAIIRQMETKNPQLKENADFEQTLWDHLYLMSHRVYRKQTRSSASPIPSSHLRRSSGCATMES